MFISTIDWLNIMKNKRHIKRCFGCVTPCTMKTDDLDTWYDSSCRYPEKAYGEDFLNPNIHWVLIDVTDGNSWN